MYYRSVPVREQGICISQGDGTMKKKLLASAIVLALLPGTCSTSMYQQLGFSGDGFDLSAKYLLRFSGGEDPPPEKEGGGGEDPPDGNDPPNAT